MKQLIPYIILISLLCMQLVPARVSAQPDRFAKIEQQLKTLGSSAAPGLKEKIEISVSSTTLKEFLRGVGGTHNLNINVASDLNDPVVFNLAGETVDNVMLFLCKEHDLDIQFVGSIMSFTRYQPPATPAPPAVVKDPKVIYNVAKNTLSFDLKKDTLAAVTTKITTLSKKAVMPGPGLGSQLVDGFIPDLDFKSAISKLAYANNLDMREDEEGTLYLEAKPVEEPAGNNNQRNNRNNRNNKNNLSQDELPEGLEITVSTNAYGKTVMNVVAAKAKLTDVIRAAADKMKVDYILISEPQGDVTLTLNNATFDELMDNLLQPTEYTYRKDSVIYIVGDRKVEGLRDTRVIQLEYRSVENIVDFIPSAMKDGVEITPTNELNSLILSGSAPQINEIASFIREIDQVIPVVLIEVIIVDVSKSRQLKTGINAGVGGGDTSSTQTLLPNFNYNLSTSSINGLLSVLSTNGLVNLGQVTPDFYLSLNALEENGNIKIKSTPKLATMNGHEASMSIGETDYYVEDRRDIIGSQNPQSSFTRVYKPLNANMTLNINPIVSGDEYVTLDISVDISSFKEQVSPDAPRGTTNRSFQSMIRVKNEEMIVLGGLEEKTVNRSTSGFPILSRIPVIRWFFSTKSDSKSKGKLNVFIKPTVIY